MLEEVEHEMRLGSATVQFSHLMWQWRMNKRRSREMKIALRLLDPSIQVVEVFRAIYHLRGFFFFVELIM